MFRHSLSVMRLIRVWRLCSMKIRFFNCATVAFRAGIEMSMLVMDSASESACASSSGCASVTAS